MRHQAYDGLPTRPRLCAWHRANTSNDTRTQTNDTGCQNICEQHTSQTCESTCTTTLLYRHKLLLCTIAAGAAQTFRLSLTRTVRDRKLGRQTARSKNALFCTFTIEYISRYSQAALMKRQITFHTHNAILRKHVGVNKWFPKLPFGTRAPGTMLGFLMFGSPLGGCGARRRPSHLLFNII